MTNDKTQAAAKILDWYDRYGRDLPWRTRQGERPDPYRIWLSEIMLQQTTVATVKGYYDRFLDRWPTVHALAKADLDEVLGQWAGLGYYARARNLYKCAQVVSQGMDGKFPGTQEGLKGLPGIGDYTSAAIAALAFDRHAVVVDGNVERVMARRFAVLEPLPAVKKTLKALAADLTPEARCGDYAQAVMDLGATICTPKSPKCKFCPWSEDCQAKAQDIASQLPKRLKKTKRPTRFGVAYWIADDAGRVLLRKRPETGLLGGMMEVPSNDWQGTPLSPEDLKAQAPLPASWRAMPDPVVHVFTHFRLELTVAVMLSGRTDGVEGAWVRPEDFRSYALPSLFLKVVNAVQGG